MFRPFPLFIGLRYSLARKHSFILSFVSLISMLGVSLGVLVLIVALSLLNGSITVLREETLKSVPHVLLSGPAVAADWRSGAALALAHPEVTAAAPYIEGEAVLRHQGVSGFLRLRGVVADLEAAVADADRDGLYERHYARLLQRLAAAPDGIILGTRLAARMGVFGEDELSVTPLYSVLRRGFSDYGGDHGSDRGGNSSSGGGSIGLRVVGIADFGLYGNDDIAVVNLARAESLFAPDPGVGMQLRLRVADVFRAGAIAEEALGGTIEGTNADLHILPWNVARANLFNALAMEKVMTAFMLLMIVAVGAVNIVSTLVMAVSDKGADIAILRTLGADSRQIMAVFVVQGLLAGAVGTVLGGGLGLLLADGIDDLSLLLEWLLNNLLTEDIYFVSHLEARIRGVEVLLVCGAALLVSFLATLYPAYRAGRIQPAEVLRYE